MIPGNETSHCSIDKSPDSGFEYALRRTITPWNADELLCELINFCHTSKIEEVILKIDPEEFTHGIPSESWLKSYMPILKNAKLLLEEVGIRFSLNPWITLGHCDRGIDNRIDHPEIGLMVGHNGTKCRFCSCPLSSGWRRKFSELWTDYASLHPYVIWVEDDIRLLNHQPVEYGCFCEEHMAQFSSRVQAKVTRKELVDALLKQGSPHPYRSEWLDMNGEIMNDVAGMIEKTVHAVSPSTMIGLMSSMPNHHAIEGRDWYNFCRILAGNQKLVSRPCMGNYSESSLRGLYESEFFVRQTMHCVGKDAIVQTELESWPFTTYSKSTKFTFLQMALSCILGADAVAMNIFDHVGSSISAAPEYGGMLAESKTFLNTLASRCKNTNSSGIGLLHNHVGSRFVEMPADAHYESLAPNGQMWRLALEPLGYPVTFSKSQVRAVNGQVLRGFDKQQIIELLSGGMLLDLEALNTLVDMGYKDYVGATVKRTFRKNSESIAAEEYHNARFGGKSGIHMTLALPGVGGNPLFGELITLPGAEVISHIVDCDRNKLYPLVTLFENELGGRIAIIPIDVEHSMGVSFLNTHRRIQFENIISWLGRDKVPLRISGGSYPLPFRCDSADNYSVVGTINLTLDAWPSVRCEMNGEIRHPIRLEKISNDGQWQSCDHLLDDSNEGRVCIEDSEPLEPTGIRAYTIWWQ